MRIQVQDKEHKKKREKIQRMEIWAKEKKYDQKRNNNPDDG